MSILLNVILLISVLLNKRNLFREVSWFLYAMMENFFEWYVITGSSIEFSNVLPLNDMLLQWTPLNSMQWWNSSLNSIFFQGVPLNSMLLNRGFLWSPLLNTACLYREIHHSGIDLFLGGFYWVLLSLLDSRLLQNINWTMTGNFIELNSIKGIYLNHILSCTMWFHYVQSY